MSTQYNPDVIQTFADKLYAQARSTVIAYTFSGVLIGGLTGFVLSWFTLNNQALIPITAIGALLLGLLFFSAGRSHSFELRLKAQQALCLMRIERNTFSDSL